MNQINSLANIEATDKPAPLSPAGCDLKHFAFMPLDVRRLLNSEIWEDAALDPKIAHAAVSLWCEAWHQVPSGSLPDRDATLMRLALCGSKDWARVKGRVMAGWVRCSDGRLYHPTVCEKALEAWLEVLISRKASRAGNSKRWNLPADNSLDPQIRAARAMLESLNPNSRQLRKRADQRPDRNPLRIPIGTPVAVAIDNDKDNDKPMPAARAASPSGDPKTQLYQRGVEILGENSGGVVTDLLKAKGSIPSARSALEAASEKATPREYIGAIIRNTKARAIEAGGLAYDSAL